MLPLVEIIRAEQSSDEAVEAAYAWAEQAGKQPVRANDTPGFIVNRVLVPTLNECIRLLDEGITPEDLDKAMTMGVGWPMGPLALVDSWASTSTSTRRRRCTRRPATSGPSRPSASVKWPPKAASAGRPAGASTSTPLNSTGP